MKEEFKNIKTKQVKGFTLKYSIDLLVYYEQHKNYNEAFERERQLKKWNRKWKLELIEKSNQDWEDLSKKWF